MKSTDPFDTAAAEYDAWFETHPHVYASELAAIRELIPKSGRGVEIGVGTGRFAAPLGIQLGVDPSTQMSRIAQKRGVEVLTGRAEDLPLADESIDFVLMVTTLCFLDEIEQAFGEIYRILRPGGAFVVAFIDADSPLGRQYLQRRSDSRFYKGAHFYSATFVKEQLRMAGFGAFDMRQTIFSNPDKMNELDPIQKGSGKGLFVVIRAIRPEDR